MAGIRISSRNKKIEVNDDGEFIILPFDDESFPGRVFAMLDRVQARSEQAKQEEEAIRSNADAGSWETTKAVAKLSEEIHRYIMAEVDGVFGTGTCKKVFGDIVPSIDLFEEFFDQLTPYFEEYGRYKRDKASKYNAARMGNV